MSELSRLMAGEEKDGGIRTFYRNKFFLGEKAERERRCTNCLTTIKVGEKCLRFQYGTSYYKVTANLCTHCVKSQMRRKA